MQTALQQKANLAEVTQRISTKVGLTEVKAWIEPTLRYVTACILSLHSFSASEAFCPFQCRGSDMAGLHTENSIGTSRRRPTDRWSAILKRTFENAYVPCAAAGINSLTHLCVVQVCVEDVERMLIRAKFDVGHAFASGAPQSRAAAAASTAVPSAATAASTTSAATAATAAIPSSVRSSSTSLRQTGAFPATTRRYFDDDSDDEALFRAAAASGAASGVPPPSIAAASVLDSSTLGAATVRSVHYGPTTIYAGAVTESPPVVPAGRASLAAASPTRYSLSPVRRADTIAASRYSARAPAAAVAAAAPSATGLSTRDLRASGASGMSSAPASASETLRQVRSRVDSLLQSKYGHSTVAASVAQPPPQPPRRPYVPMNLDDSL